MTRITFFLKDGKYVGFESKGHAGYAESGYDIVCASVSALTQTALGAILEIVKADTEYRIEDGLLYCKLKGCSPEQSEKASLILDSIRLGLCSIQTNYKKYLRICVREVTA